MRCIRVYFLLFCILDSIFALESLESKKADSKRIEQFYSCIENDEKSCNDLLNSGIMGVEECDATSTCAIIAHIFIKAGRKIDSIKYYEKACLADVLQACYEAGEVYQSLKEYKAAAMKYQNSCRFGYLPSCHSLALLYESGSGVRENVQKYRSLLNENCLNGYDKSCYALGMIYRNNDRLKSLKLFQKACELGHSQACKEYKILNAARFNLQIEDYINSAK